MPYKDPARRKACHDKWVKENPERNREHKRKWRTENLEQARASARRTSRRARKKDPEKIRTRNRLWMREWAKENPEIVRKRSHDSYWSHRDARLNDARMHSLAQRAIHPRKKMSDVERKAKAAARQRERYASDPEKYRAMQQTYRAKNADSLRESKRRWGLKNRALLRNREYHRYANDPEFRLRKLLRAAHRRMVGLAGATPRRSTRYDLGCSYAEARVHIERQFRSGMTWDNAGEWHLDHVRPLVSYDLHDPEQFKQAAHYTNLQPLWGHENLSKLDKWHGDPDGCRIRQRGKPKLRKGAKC